MRSQFEAFLRREIVHSALEFSKAHVSIIPGLRWFSSELPQSRRAEGLRSKGPKAINRAKTQRFLAKIVLKEGVTKGGQAIFGFTRENEFSVFQFYFERKNR